MPAAAARYQPAELRASEVTDADLKDLYERQASAYIKRPDFAVGGGSARVRLLEDLRCEVAHGDRVMLSDLPVNEGGTGIAPHPGQLMRASLGACLAMGYRLWGARLEVPVDRVVVEVTCEFDARGQMGLSDEVPVGWRRIQVDVTIASPAPPARVQALVAHANRRSPMLANLSPDILQLHHLTVLPR
jgi:uncharacterized OsmC-like protein